LKAGTGLESRKLLSMGSSAFKARELPAEVRLRIDEGGEFVSTPPTKEAIIKLPATD